MMYQQNIYLRLKESSSKEYNLIHIIVNSDGVYVRKRNENEPRKSFILSKQNLTYRSYNWNINRIIQEDLDDIETIDGNVTYLWTFMYRYKKDKKYINPIKSIYKPFNSALIHEFYKDDFDKLSEEDKQFYSESEPVTLKNETERLVERIDLALTLLNRDIPRELKVEVELKEIEPLVLPNLDLNDLNSDEPAT